MLPVIAIVGRPNVGKSTLFNCLTKTRDALVANQRGLTRDRQYGRGEFEEHPFIVIDTGGIAEDEGQFDALVSKQVNCAIDESDIILFMVDARDGVTPADEEIANKLRKEIKKPVFLVVNKIDGLDAAVASAEFFSLGFGDPISIAASHQRGIKELLQKIFVETRFLASQSDMTEQTVETRLIASQSTSCKVAIIGRPNVGKSTLVNRILGEERVIVFDQPGTTRDSIYIPFERRGQHYTIIDTAGVRRRGKVFETIEKFSIVKTLKAIEDANVVLFLIDGQQEVAEQDLKLLGLVLESGKSLVIAVNKWDGLSDYEKERIKQELDRRLVFVSYAKIHFISALHGTGVGNLFKSIDQVYKSATKKLSTPLLTRILEKAVEMHQPPLVGGRRIKLRYAHAGGKNPPIIVIHGTRVSSLPASYKKYLENVFRETLHLVGTPIRIQLRSEKM